MRIRQLREVIAAGVLLLAGASTNAASAPTTTYKFSCNGPNPPALSLTLVSFSLPVSRVASSSGSSGSTTKIGPLTIVFQPNSAITEMLAEVEGGQLFETCSLLEKVVTPASGGSAGSTASYRWNLALVRPTGLTAIGTSSSNSDSAGANVPTGLMQATYEVGAIEVTAGP